MNEEPLVNGPSSPAPTTQDVVALIKKMQEQLAGLEKKLDALLARPPERSFGEKRFPTPYRRFASPGHHPHREHDRTSGPSGVAPGGKKYFGKGHHFQAQHGAKKPGFDRAGKPGFDHKKKPFYHRHQKT